MDGYLGDKSLHVLKVVHLCWEDKLKDTRERMAALFVLGFAIAMIPLYIFGFVGNTMVIRIVHKTREMHTTTNYPVSYTHLTLPTKA